MRPTPVSILRLLADARFHAPSAVARALEAPLDEVRACIEELAAEGLVRERDPEGRVRLGVAPDLLDPDAVRAALRAAQSPVDLEVVDECVSTNAVLMARAVAGAPSGHALACERQTAGRGRRGTGWLAPLGGALAFSLLWRMPRVGAQLAGLSLAAGVACVRALARAGVQGVALKWPNDLVHGGRKLGGILVEAAPDGAGSAVVCGIGLNTRLPAAAHAAIGQAATDLAALCPRPPSRSALLAALLDELGGAMHRFAADGFAAFRSDWLRHHAHQGADVTLRLADARIVAGRALGVAEDGALLVEHGGRVERFHAGEVSLRAAA